MLFSEICSGSATFNGCRAGKCWKCHGLQCAGVWAKESQQSPRTMKSGNCAENWMLSQLEMTLVSFAESLSVQLVISYSYVLLGDPQQDDRTKSGVRVYRHIHTCGPFVWHHKARQEKRDKEDLKEYLQLAQTMRTAAVTHHCHALWWCWSFGSAAKWLKGTQLSIKLRPRELSASLLPDWHQYVTLLTDPAEPAALPRTCPSSWPSKKSSCVQ